jgi:tetratricopeptide (TPR) repeat protein
MAEKNTVNDGDRSEVVIARAKDFWARNSKIISITCVVVVLGVAGYFIYKNYIQKPKEVQSVDALFKAEEYYRMDSFRLALNGDGQYYGFLRVIDKYGGTKSGNLACYYAGVSYLRLDDNQNAIKYLKKFSTDSEPVQARTYKMLGDASADLGKHSDAVDYYKKAAKAFTADKEGSSEALFAAAYLTDKTLKKQKEAIELYKEVKSKYPRTTGGMEAEKFLAQLGVYTTE